MFFFLFCDKFVAPLSLIRIFLSVFIKKYNYMIQNNEYTLSTKIRTIVLVKFINSIISMHLTLCGNYNRFIEGILKDKKGKA